MAVNDYSIPVVFDEICKLFSLKYCPIRNL